MNAAPRARPEPHLDPARSVDVLLQRALIRILWVGAVAMGVLVPIQLAIPTLPRSQGLLSLGATLVLAGLGFALRRSRPSPRSLDISWYAVITSISVILALRVWVDPVPMRAYLLLIPLPMAGIFIRSRSFTLLTWFTQTVLVLLGWGLARPAFHRWDLVAVNLIFFMGIGIWIQVVVRDFFRRVQARIRRLAAAKGEIRALEGLIPICAHCKKVRNDSGFWEQVEGYLTRRQVATFSHGICEGCLAQLQQESESVRGHHRVT